MLSMILKMSILTIIYAAIALAVYKFMKGREMDTRAKIGIGLVFGLLSVFSTHTGVDYNVMVLNVRDLGPMIAGLMFDPVSGIIAGLIGGIERYIAGTYFDIGYFTRTACSLSTCLAGVFAAVMNRYIFNGKRPSTAYAFFLGAVVEVFHMYVILATHRGDMEMALGVVQACSIPMIVFNGLGMALTSLVIRKYNGENTDPFKWIPSRDVPVSNRFQRWLFGVTATVLIINFYINFNLQTRAVIQDVKADIVMGSEEISETYKEVKGRGGNVSHLRFYIGRDGQFYIYDRNDDIIAGSQKAQYADLNLRDMVRNHRYGVFFVDTVDNTEWLCRMQNIDSSADLLIRVPTENIYMARNAQAYETMLADILVFTVIYILISTLVQRIVVDNLLKVNRSLNRITEGDLDEKVDVYNSAEFASLSDDINLTVEALKGYIDAAEKRIEQELLLARTIQESALPRNFEFSHGGFELFASMDPAREVGGDFYDFFFVDTDVMALLIADVSGKGIPAALFMMHSKTAIRSLAETGVQPVEVMSRVNNELCENNEAGMFVTVWMGFIDLRTGRIRCVNAGHEYPSIMRKDGDYELYRERHGLPLGAMEDACYKEYELQLGPGDCLFVYTDGVPEAINKAEEQYGTDRMLGALNANRDASVADLLTAVKNDIDGFVKNADQFDDITMLGFRYEGIEET